MARRTQTNLVVEKISILSEVAATKYGDYLSAGSLTLEQFTEVTKNLRCIRDGGILEDKIYAFPHAEGFTVKSYATRQRLSKRCTQCRHIWNIILLGIPVDLEDENKEMSEKFIELQDKFRERYLDQLKLVGNKTLYLADYECILEGAICRWDGTVLDKTVDSYDHDGGWTVSGFNKKQWLSKHCSKCGYDWSIIKLGIFQS